MARPRAVYRGKRKYGWLISLVLFLLIFAFMAGIWVFYDLQKYIVYEKDGLRLDFSGAALGADSDEGEDESILAPPVTDAQIVIELPDYSEMKSRVKSSLGDIQALYVTGDKMTAQNLAYYPALLASSETKYNCLVLNMKSADGNLHYFSGIPMTNSYGVNGTESLKETLAALKEYDIWLVAEISGLVDSAMAVRNAPLALRNATGGVLSDGSGSWLDPYNSDVRQYMKDLMAEMKDLGFDEVLFTNLRLPADTVMQYSQAMSAMPDSVSALSSFCGSLRDAADEIGIYVSAELDGNALRENTGREIGQDAGFFFKVFDRVYVTGEADYYITNTIIALDLADGKSSRVVTTVEGFNIPSGSFFVR